MKNINWQLFITILMLFVFLITPVFGSDISNAQFKGTITVANNSTAATYVSSNITNINSTSFIAGGYLNATGNNTAITTTSGADVAFMPGYGSSEWQVWVPSISEDAYLSYLFYSGNVTGGKIRYFPGTAGVVTNDGVFSELSNNFSVEISGYYKIDTTTTQKIIEKPNAYKTHLMDTSVVTGIGADLDDAGEVMYGAAFWKKQQVVLTVGEVIDSILVKVYKQGAPVGNLDVGIRDAAGTSADYTTGSIVASTIALTTGEWYEVPITPYTVPATATYSIVLRVPDGDISNRIVWRGVNAGGYAGGVNSTSTDGGATWIDDTHDFCFLVGSQSFGYGSKIVSYSMSSGEHTIKSYADGTDLKLDIDGSNVDSEALAGASVPNNANAWTFAAGGSLPYAEYLKITAAGTLEQHLAWQYAATLTDQSGLANNPTSVSFATASSDADVSASLTSFGPNSTSQAPAYSIDISTIDLIPEVPTATGNFTTGVAPVSFPFSSLITDAATASSTPAQLPFMIISGFLILIISLLVSWLMRQYSGGSLFIKGLVILVLMGIAVALGIYDPWMLILFVFLAIAAAMASKQISWG